MSDLISRADAIEAVRKELVCDGRHEAHDKTCRFIADVLLSALPSAEGGDAEVNETKSPYMQQSPNNGADLISRQDAIDTVEELNRKVNDGREFDTICTSDVLRRINALPSAEAPEVECYVNGQMVVRGVPDGYLRDDIEGVIVYSDSFCKSFEVVRSERKGGDDE